MAADAPPAPPDRVQALEERCAWLERQADEAATKAEAECARARDKNARAGEMVRDMKATVAKLQKERTETMRLMELDTERIAALEAQLGEARRLVRTIHGLVKGTSSIMLPSGLDGFIAGATKHWPTEPAHPEDRA